MLGVSACCDRFGRDNNLTDLNHRLNVRVIGNICHELGAMLGEARLELFQRVKIYMPHRDVLRPGAGCCTSDTVLHRDAFARRPEPLPHHRHMTIAVILHIERGAVLVGIENAHFDHLGQSIAVF